MSSSQKMHSAHWGAFQAELQQDNVSITPFAGDPDPSPLLGNFTNALTHPVRVTRPMIRRGWLEQGPGQIPDGGMMNICPSAGQRRLHWSVVNCGG